MKENRLVDLSMELAVDVVGVCREIKAMHKETILTNQLMRSGTSIGANIREANYAHGKNDFIAKLQIALKECYESEYWIELMCKTGLIFNDISNMLMSKLGTIRKLLISSINTTKNNLTK